MVPKLFKQLLIINVQISECLYVPALFALLPSKKTQAYTTVFNYMKKFFEDLQLGPLQSTFAMADFERSLRNAWTETFPKTPLKNCYFHYAKVRVTL